MLNELKLIYFYFLCEFKQCDIYSYHDNIDIDGLIDEHNLCLIKDIVFELLDDTYIDGFELAIESALSYDQRKDLFYILKNNYPDICSNIHKKVKSLMPLLVESLYIPCITTDETSLIIANDKSLIVADNQHVAKFSLNECKLLWITNEFSISTDGIKLISLKDNEIVGRYYYSGSGSWHLFCISFIDGRRF